MVFATAWVTWDQAAIAAMLSVIVVLVLGRLEPSRLTLMTIPVAREFAFTASIYSVWRLARYLPLTQPDGALDRAREIARFQEWLHIPSELGLQQWLMAHDLLSRVTIWYYAVVHVPALIVFLIWMFVRHRDHYPRWRTALMVSTAFCVVIRFWRVAPPRFLPELGFVDLSTRLGLSVYGPVGTGVSDQYAAMPSIHVAWAAVVSFGAVAASRSPWRWLVFSHVFITIVVVAATGHHWWADSFAAVGLLGLALLMDRVGRRAAARNRFPLVDLDALSSEVEAAPSTSLVEAEPHYL